MVYVLGTIVTLCLLWVIYNLFKKQEQVSKSPVLIKYLVPGGVAILLGFFMLFVRNGTFVIAIICMAFSFLGMIYCARRQKFYAYAQPVAISLLVVILICMVLILTKTMGSGDVSYLIENEIKFAKAGAYIMGQELAKTYSGKKALVIAPNKWRDNRRMLEIVSGLKKGLNGKLEIKAIESPVIPKPKKTNPEMPEDYMMFEEMLQAEHYNKLISKNKDCNFLIFLTNLPHDMVNLNIWEMDDDKRPMVALLYSDIYSLKRAIKAGYITALTYKPNVKFTEEPPPKDYKEAFDKRYIIVTPKNVDEISEKYQGFLQDFK